MISSNRLSVYYLVSAKGDVGVGWSSNGRQEGRERTVLCGGEVLMTVPSFPPRAEGCYFILENGFADKTEGRNHFK